MDKEDSQDGSSSSPAASPPRPRSPLCLFYFSHPFRVADPEEEMQDLEMSRRERVALDLVAKKRQQMLARRKRSVLQRRIWRRYLREPFWDLKTCLFANNEPAGGASNTTTTPSLDEVLRTIRNAWEPPRCFPSDRESATDEVLEEAGMGTDRGMSRKTKSQVPTNPGLPHRRYSVPETVMRKYSLTKQCSGSSDSGVATVPVATPDTISSNPLGQISNSSSDESRSRPSGGSHSSSDSSDHKSVSVRNAKSDKMGNRPTRSRRSPVLSEVPSRSTLGTVSEESPLGKLSEDTLERVSSLKEDISNPVSLKSKSSSNRKKDEKNNIHSDKPENWVQDDFVSTQTTVEQPIEDRSQCAESKKTNVSKTSESLEPQSSVKDDMSSSQTLGLDSKESRPPSLNDKEEQILTPKISESPEPKSSVKDDLSSSQTLGIASTESRPHSTSNKENEISINTSKSMGPQRSINDDSHSPQTLESERTDSQIKSTHEKGKDKSSANNTASTEPQSSLRDELSSSQTMDIESTEEISQSKPNKETTQILKQKAAVDKSKKSEHTKSSGSSINRSVEPSPLETEDTVEPASSPREDLSSSQTMGVASTESKPSPDRPPDRTRSSTPGGDVSFTPTECCVSTPEQSLSDRASESCSITPMGQTSSSSVTGSSPERPSAELRSTSPEQPSSEHTLSTQDATLSIKSESIILGRPVSVLRGSVTPITRHISDSEQSIGHIEFMNDTVDNESRPLLSILGKNDSKSVKLSKSESTESNSQQTGDSGHATEPECKISDGFCGSSNFLLESETNYKTGENEKSPTSVAEPETKQNKTCTESVHCRHQSRAWEIIIQPTIMQDSSSKCLENSACGTKMGSSENKFAILPTKNQDMEFCGAKTYLLIRPSGSTTMQTGARFCGTQNEPLTKPRSTPSGIKTEAITSSSNVEVFNPQRNLSVSPSRREDSGPYSWSRLTGEERAVQLQHQRHRLWMNRRLSADNALPPSPMHGPLSSCIGTGSTYRKSYDIQLVVPRYSALPRSVSMLVNTSSADCSSNSNSDSECLSLVDSLEEKSSSVIGKHMPTKHDSKLVRGDIVQLLPEQATVKHDSHKRIKPATPRGKGKAFFVSMAGGLDEIGEVKVEENTDNQVVSKSMPDRLKKKLSQRHQQMELRKKKKKRHKNESEVENNENIEQKKLLGTQDLSIISTDKKENVISNQENQNKNIKSPVAQPEVTTEEHNITKPSHMRKGSVSQEKIKCTERIVSPNRNNDEHVQSSDPTKSLSPSILNSTAHGISGGTFIVSKTDKQAHEDYKSAEQENPINKVLKGPIIENMVQKEQIPEEHSPPVKRFKASRRKVPPQTKTQQLVSTKTPKPSINSTSVQREQKPEEQNPKPEEQNPKPEEPNPRIKTQNSVNTLQKKCDVPEQDDNTETSQHRGDEHCQQEELCLSDISKIPDNSAKLQKQSASLESGAHTTQKGEKKCKSLTENKVLDTKINNPGSKIHNPENEILPDKTVHHEISSQNLNKSTKIQKLTDVGKGTLRDSSSPEAIKTISKSTEKPETNKPTIQEEKTRRKLEISETLVQKNNAEVMKETKVKTPQVTPTIEIKSSPDTVSYQKIELKHGRKTDISNMHGEEKPQQGEKYFQEKLLNTVSCQTSPSLSSHEEKSTSTPNTPTQHDVADSVLINIASKSHMPVKSSIPIMKSPIGNRKPTADTTIALQQSFQKNSHLPIRRTTRQLHAPPIRRSANLLGARFHQKFEVIPEERSCSLESSTEDQVRMPNDRNRRVSLPDRHVNTRLGTGNSATERSNVVSHSCLGLNQPRKHNASYKYKQNKNNAYKGSISNNESSSSNQDEKSSSNGSMKVNNTDDMHPIIRRSTCQSRIPRAEKITRQSRLPDNSLNDEQEEKNVMQNYQGKAALAPHNEDKDLLSLSKGWINFYLLKDGRGTPDSSCGEAPTDISDKEERLTRRKCTPYLRTVTVVGADDNRIRQYTIQNRTSEDDKNKENLTTTLPELNSNCSSRRPSLVSLEKLPISMLEPSSSPADSDNSTTYLCLPSPRLKTTNLLEGSGELACSESSSMASSSDSEPDRATSPAVLPVKWPFRQLRRGPPHHRSRSRTKHYKTSEQFQSHYQNGGGGSTGWTVTVAGSNACPQQPPELEMRLSFPSCARQPAASQSDSGLGEDNNNGEKTTKEQQIEEEKTQDDDESQHFLPPAQSAPQSHRWTLMLKNQGGSEISKAGKRAYQCLPDLGYNPGQNKNSKKVLKRPETSLPVTSLTDEDARKSKKFSLLWPKVQKIIQSKVIIRKSSGHISQEVKSVAQFLESDDGAIVLRSGLAIKGSAITPEKKPRVPTMSERDLTRIHTAKH